MSADEAMKQIAHELADPQWTEETLNRIAEIVTRAGYSLVRRSSDGKEITDGE